MKLPEKKEEKPFRVLQKLDEGYFEVEINLEKIYNDCLDEVRKLNQGWISVEDRLPEEKKLVLVFGGVARLENGIWYTYTGCFRRKIIWKVTHWQPLPEPPEIVGEES